MFFGVRSGFNWGAFEFLTEDFFVLDLMEDGEKSSSQAIVDGYDFDTVDYTDCHCLRLYLCHVSVANKTSRLNDASDHSDYH